MNWQATSPCSKQPRGGPGRSSLTPVLWWSRWLLAGSSSDVRRYDAFTLNRESPGIDYRGVDPRASRSCPVLRTWVSPDTIGPRSALLSRHEDVASGVSHH